MEKSNIEKLKDAVLYAPVGALGFVKDNAPTFFSMFVSRGKREVSKTQINAEEKLSTTKEHGQFVAMGTPIFKTRAEKLAEDAKGKGEEVAHITIDVALGALGLIEGAFKTVTSTISGTTHQAPVVKKPHLTSVQEAASAPTTQERSGSIQPKEDWTPEIPQPAQYNHFAAQPTTTHEPSQAKEFSATIEYHEAPTFVPDSFDALAQAEGDFVAEPVDPSLPARIRAEYEILSAPEIIDRLDEFAREDLETIRAFEQDFRNRQTIIHAINYRLNENL